MSAEKRGERLDPPHKTMRCARRFSGKFGGYSVDLDKRAPAVSDIHPR
jgi:hypothetical protein